VAVVLHVVGDLGKPSDVMGEHLQDGVLLIQFTLADELNALAQLKQHKIGEGWLCTDEELLLTTLRDVIHHFFHLMD